MALSWHPSPKRTRKNRLDQTPSSATPNQPKAISMTTTDPATLRLEVPRQRIAADRLCCKPDVGVGQIRTTTVLSSCFCVGQTVL